MEIIQCKFKQGFQNDVSSLCIADIPEERFCINGNSSSNIWFRFILNSLWLSYFGLILKGLIKIEVKSKQNSFLFGLITMESKYYFPKLTENYDSSIDFEWLEKTIMNSLDNKVVINDLTLKEQVVRIVNILLGFNDKYVSPDKELLKRIMLNDSHKFWDCTFDEKLFHSRRYIVLKINSLTQYNLRSMLDEIKDYEKKMINMDKNLKKFRSIFKKIVMQELGKKTEFHPVN
jgi:hypothetical protein